MYLYFKYKIRILYLNTYLKFIYSEPVSNVNIPFGIKGEKGGKGGDRININANSLGGEGGGGGHLLTVTDVADSNKEIEIKDPLYQMSSFLMIKIRINIFISAELSILETKVDLSQVP